MAGDRPSLWQRPVDWDGRTPQRPGAGLAGLAPSPGPGPAQPEAEATEESGWRAGARGCSWKLRAEGEEGADGFARPRPRLWAVRAALALSGPSARCGLGSPWEGVSLPVVVACKAEGALQEVVRTEPAETACVAGGARNLRLGRAHSRAC